MRTLGFLKTQRGINMVEVLVTIVITSVGLLGLNSLQLQASRSTLDSGNRSQAVWVLEDLTNRMRANIVGIEHYGTGSTAMKCGGTMPTMCSSYHDGSNKVLAAANCGNEEQAKSDLHEVLCGFGATVSGSEVTFGSSANYIANPELVVAVDTNKNAKLTLSWNVRTSGQDASGDAVYASNSSNTDKQRASITTEVHP